MPRRGGSTEGRSAPSKRLNDILPPGDPTTTDTRLTSGVILCTLESREAEIEVTGVASRWMPLDSTDPTLPGSPETTEARRRRAREICSGVSTSFFDFLRAFGLTHLQQHS